MIPFEITIKDGAPLYEQVIFAVKRALLTGHLKEGDLFPSQRVLSQELRINPNTAQKVITSLKVEGILIARPGIGMVVSNQKKKMDDVAQENIASLIETLVVEASQVSLELDSVVQQIETTWQSINKKNGLFRKIRG